jgi:chromosome partitioning protein
MARIVTFYNNKGGVSKTTTLFNLGVFLAQEGKRVLIADCDPQCNATELFFASTDLLDDPGADLPGTSVYQALAPRFRGEIARIDPDSVDIVESSLYENLFLLRGDLEFSLAETYLANAWNQAITENIHEKNTYLALHGLLEALSNLRSFDYVICDVGPSTGAITRAVVLACDGFFLPLTPDRFCNQAVKVLGRVIQDWVSRHQQTSRSFAPFGMHSFVGRPMLLGAIMQIFKTHGSKTKASYSKWQTTIAETMQQSLRPGTGIPVASTFNPAEPFVANIRDVGPLAPVAQMFGRAIFDVQQEHTKEASTTGGPYQGVVWQNWEERKAAYKAEIEKIAEALG